MGDTKTAPCSFWGLETKYLYGMPYGLSEEGKVGARQAAEACAEYKTKETGKKHVAMESSCNVADGAPQNMPQGCFRVVNTENWLDRVIRFFSNGK